MLPLRNGRCDAYMSLKINNCHTFCQTSAFWFYGEPIDVMGRHICRAGETCEVKQSRVFEVSVENTEMESETFSVNVNLGLSAKGELKPAEKPPKIVAGGGSTKGTGAPKPPKEPEMWEKNRDKWSSWLRPGKSKPGKGKGKEHDGQHSSGSSSKEGGGKGKKPILPPMIGVGETYSDVSNGGRKNLDRIGDIGSLGADRLTKHKDQHEKQPESSNDFTRPGPIQIEDQPPPAYPGHGTDTGTGRVPPAPPPPRRPGAGATNSRPAPPTNGGANRPPPPPPAAAEAGPSRQNRPGPGSAGVSSGTNRLVPPHGRPGRPRPAYSRPGLSTIPEGSGKEESPGDAWLSRLKGNVSYRQPTRPGADPPPPYQEMAPSVPAPQSDGQQPPSRQPPSQPPLRPQLPQIPPAANEERPGDAWLNRLKGNMLRSRPI